MNGMLIIVLAAGFAALCMALVAIADIKDDDE